uniref:Uncharacterized protein n=1 Tax=Peronospora matthiolae TaxID=2874970 RepID=A0AAV1UEA9_9STRA
MWTHIVSYFDGKQNGKTKFINTSITYDKLQRARSQSGSDIEGHSDNMFNLWEPFETFGATVDDFQMNRF